MKKLLLLIPTLLCSAYLMHATEQSTLEASNEQDQQQEEEQFVDLDDIAKGAYIVNFNIMLYKDRNSHDATEWQTVVTKAAQSIYRLQNEQTTHSILKELNEIINAIQNNENDTGIVGEFSVSVSDGLPMKDCCGANCRCAQLYRGNCPCSLNSAAANRCAPIPDEDDGEEVGDNAEASGKDSFEEVNLNEEVTTKKSCCK